MAWKPPSAVPDTTWMPPSAVADNTNVGGTLVDTKGIAQDNANTLKSLPGKLALGATPMAMGALGAGAGMLTAGPPGAVIGGSLGWGAGGEIQRQQKKALGQSVSQGQERVSDLRNNLYAGMLAEGGGQLASMGTKGLAKGAMKSALRPTVATMKAEPTLIEDAIKSKTTVGGAGPLSRILGGGAEGAWNKVWKSDAKLQPMLQEAMANGWGRQASDYEPAMEKYIKENIEGQTPHWQDRANEIRMWFGKFVDQNQGKLDPLRVQSLKQGAQLEGKAIYDKKMADLVPLETQKLKQFHAALGTILKNSLESIGGVAERNAQTAPLIRSADAASRAEYLGSPLASELMARGMAGAGALIHGGPFGPVGDAALGYFGTKAATSPWTMSRAALALHYGIAPAMRVAPYGAIGAFQPALNDRGY